MSGHLSCWKHWLLVLIGLAGLAIPACAEELKIEATLIWATNDEKFSDPKYKDVDSKLAEELRKIFAWKRYFEVSRQKGVVANRSTKSFKVSDKCVVEITEIEGPKVEVKLIGEGKPVNKTTKALSRGTYFTLGGGDSKNGSAWFVVISQLDEKAAGTAPAQQATNKAVAAPDKTAKSTNTAAK